MYNSSTGGNDEGDMSKKILLIVCFVIMLTSCGINDDDGHIARDNMIKLVEYIQNDEIENVMELFSPTIKNEIKDLESQIIVLCDFIDGNYESITCLGLGTSIGNDYGKETKEYDMLYIIETTSCSYYYSILWKMKDDYNPENIGIWSLYVEEKLNDNSPTSHNEWNDGINIIGKKYD